MGYSEGKNTVECEGFLSVFNEVSVCWASAQTMLDPRGWDAGVLQYYMITIWRRALRSDKMEERKHMLVFPDMVFFKLGFDMHKTVVAT